MLFVAVLSFVETQATSRDTITVDGIALRLDLDLRESQSSTNLDKIRSLSGWKRSEVRCGIWIAGVRTLNSEKGIAVESIAGRPVRPSSHLELFSTWKQDDKQLRIGVSAGFRESWTYYAAGLDDSLYAVVQSNDGGLEQWIQRTYDLGIELDTIPLPFNRRLTSEARVTLERGGPMGIGRERKWNWWAGVHLNVLSLLREPDESERLPLWGRPESADVLGSNRADWISRVSVGCGLQLGVEKKLNSQWSWAMRAGWNAGVRSGVWCTAGLACSFSR